jgi:2-haloalkanoic acid dehalogenase type II
MTAARAVSFDLDGTLLDGSLSQEVIARTCDEVAPTFGLDPERLAETNAQVFRAYFPLVEASWTSGEIDGRAVTTETWRRTLRACGIDDDSAIEPVVDRYLDNRRSALRLFDDARPVLRALRRRYPLALVTNGAADTQRDALRALRLEPQFHSIAISGELGVAKPDPALFRIVIGDFGLEPDSVWHVGDSLTADVAGAINAGCVAVWLNRRRLPRTATDPQPDYEIASLLDLMALLDASGGAKRTPSLAFHVGTPRCSFGRDKKEPAFRPVLCEFSTRRSGAKLDYWSAVKIAVRSDESLASVSQSVSPLAQK